MSKPTLVTSGSAVAPGPSFVAALPRIDAHARVAFRHLRCHHTRADAAADAVALAWQCYVRLHARGRRPDEFITAIARYAARAVAAGRTARGQQAGKDVLSPLARRRHGFALTRLPDAPAADDPLAEALRDNSSTPVPDQVQFRLDFPAWVRTHGRRHRRLIAALMAGGRTQDVAAAFRISPARVSQLRRESATGWAAFTAAPSPAAGEEPR